MPELSYMEVIDKMYERPLEICTNPFVHSDGFTYESFNDRHQGWRMSAYNDLYYYEWEVGVGWQ